MEVGKVPPHDTEAEQAVIGSMLTDKDAIISAIEVLKEEELREAHGNVVGKVIISRCTNCGKVTSKLIYTETGYER